MEPSTTERLWVIAKKALIILLVACFAALLGPGVGGAIIGVVMGLMRSD